MGVINSQNIINMINFQAEIYYIRISTMSTEMHHCQNKYHGKNGKCSTLEVLVFRTKSIYIVAEAKLYSPAERSISSILCLA